MLKRIILTAIFLTTFLTANSQKTAITYYDSAWFLTTKNFGKYFRIGVIDTIKYQYYGEVKDYYMNGKLQMEGKFHANIKVDTFNFYYPNGNLMTKGLYKNNIRYGIWTNYYENGKVKDKIAFNGDFICALEFYDENGTPKMINGTGEWETEYINAFVNELVTIKGAYKDTLRDGIWIYYTKSLRQRNEGVSNEKRLECTEEYDRGKFVKGKYYWGGGAIQDIKQPTISILPEDMKFEKLEKWSHSKYVSIEAYPYLKFLPEVDSTVFPVDLQATFPGGLESLIKVFTKNLKLSKTYITSRKYRYSAFNIMIDENGKLEITQDLNETFLLSFPDNQVFYEEVLKSIKMLPDWEPAKRNGKSVKNYFMFAVHLESGKISIQLASRN